MLACQFGAALDHELLAKHAARGYMKSISQRDMLACQFGAAPDHELLAKHAARGYMKSISQRDMLIF